jgi:hypothetical protein
MQVSVEVLPVFRAAKLSSDFRFSINCDRRCNFLLLSKPSLFSREAHRSLTVDGTQPLICDITDNGTSSPLNAILNGCAVLDQRGRLQCVKERSR